jgi:hypothetical protein
MRNYRLHAKAANTNPFFRLRYTWANAINQWLQKANWIVSFLIMKPTYCVPRATAGIPVAPVTRKAG